MAEIEDRWSRATASEDILALLNRIDELKEEDRSNNDDYVHIENRYEDYECDDCHTMYKVITETKSTLDDARLEVNALQNRIDDACSECDTPW